MTNEIQTDSGPVTADLTPEKAPKERRPSLRLSINRMCRDCIYDPISGAGTWRQQVDACTSPNCPLYPVRPRSEAPLNAVDSTHGPEDA